MHSLCNGLLCLYFLAIHITAHLLDSTITANLQTVVLGMLMKASGYKRTIAIGLGF